MTALAIVFACSGEEPAEQPSAPDEDLSGYDLTKFFFSNSISTDIDRNTGIITVKMPYGSKLSGLKAHFTVADGADVFVDGVQQVSGITENNFSMPVKYKVRYNGLENIYTVAIGYSSIPVLYISTALDITSKEVWVEGGTLYMVNAGENNAIYESTSVRGRGNYTWNRPKKPYAIKLSKKAKVLGMPEHKRWVLLANYIDPSALRNAAAFEIARKAEGLAWTPSGHFVDVVLNGVFRGNYYLCEQVRVNKYRVNITEMTSTDLDDVSITGGYLCELDVNFDEVNRFRTKYGKDGDNKTGMPVMIKNPDEDVLQPAQFTYIKNYFYSLEELLYADDFPADGKYREMLDINSFIDWWLVTEIIQNREAMWPKSAFMYKDRGGKLCAGPVWDSDWNTFRENSKDWRINEAIYYGILFKDPYFVSTVKSRWARLKTNLADITKDISAIAAENKASVEYNNTIWPVISGINDFAGLSYDNNVAAINKSITDRIAWMDSAINGM